MSGLNVCVFGVMVLGLCFYLGNAWTPKVCKIMAFLAIIRGLGLLFYIFVGFRWCFSRQDVQVRV